jgi:hypothetical protein
MKKTVISFATVLLALSVCAIWLVVSRNAATRQAPLSSLQFKDVDQVVQSGLSEADLKKYSHQLRGTRVRWKGKVMGLEGDTVYMEESAVSGGPPDVEFAISGDFSRTLQKGQTLTMVGIIDDVRTLETSPPMLHTYVVLKGVRLE